MHSELPCDQEAPPCGATCGKTLLCGQHHCQERCHTGPCPATCRLLVDKSCACGLTQRRMPCSQPLRRAACDRTDSSLSPLKTCTTIQRSPACRQAAFQSYHDHGIAALLCEGRHVFENPSAKFAAGSAGAACMQVREALHSHQELRAAPVQAPLLRWQLPTLRTGARSELQSAAMIVIAIYNHSGGACCCLQHLSPLAVMCASQLSIAEKRLQFLACLTYNLQQLRRQSACCSHAGRSCGAETTCAPAPATAGPCQPCPLSVSIMHMRLRADQLSTPPAA